MTTSTTTTAERHDAQDTADATLFENICRLLETTAGGLHCIGVDRRVMACEINRPWRSTWPRLPDAVKAGIVAMVRVAESQLWGASMADGSRWPTRRSFRRGAFAGKLISGSVQP